MGAPEASVPCDRVPTGTPGASVPRKRLAWLDIVKGIAIICIVVGHTIGDGPLKVMLYSFHVPIFFVVSGYTMKPLAKAGIPAATRKDARRLLLPIVGLVAFRTVARGIAYGAAPLDILTTFVTTLLWGNGWEGYVLPVGAGIAMPSIGLLWFLVVLFWAKLLYRLVLAADRQGRTILVLVLAMLGMVVGQLAPLPQGWDLALVALPFMEAGYLYKGMGAKADSEPMRWAGVVAFLAWTTLSWAGGITIWMCSRGYVAFMGCVVVALLGCLALIEVAKALQGTMLARPLSFLGRESLVLAGFHYVDGATMRFWTLSPIDAASRLAPLNDLLNSCIHLGVLVVATLLWVFVVRKVIRSVKAGLGPRHSSGSNL